MSGRYAIHGLAVASDVPIEGPPLDGDAAVEIHIAQGAGARPGLEGEVICEIELPGLGSYCGIALEEGYALTFADYAFRMSAGLDRVEWWAPDGEREAVGHLITGNVLTFILQLMGIAVVHASVVRTPAATIAFAGHSGSGKSTLAALFCESGAELLTDDVLRLDIKGDAVMAIPGGTALRLRPAAEAVGARMIGTPSYRAQDGRLGVRPRLVTAPVPLDHVLLPLIGDDVDAPEVRRLAPRDALVALLSVPRWFGWRIPGPTRAQFRAMSALSERVAVSELRLPLHAEPPAAIVPAILERLP